MFYKNISNYTKTFHGVTFHPREIKEVPKYINHPKFVSVSSMPKEPPRSVELTKKVGRPKKVIDEASKPEAENSQVNQEQEEVLDGADCDK